jgi:multiphosphoryl transfer protein
VGVGLARSEHMFGDSVDTIWRYLTTPPGRSGFADAAEEFEVFQRRRFDELLAAVTQAWPSGSRASAPVTVRLLDAPAEEFGLVGTPRGVRLTADRPDVYRAQLSALSEAIGDMRRTGEPPAVRLLVPMVNEASEIATMVALVREYPNLHETPVGAMVETPAAALATADLVRHASHVSFGTNDLTRFALGLERDSVAAGDVSSGGGVIDPFRRLHPAVAELVRISARASGGVGCSLCGELATTAEGMDLAVELGLESVSVAPLSVPLVRLGLAQRVARGVLGVC